MTKWEVYKDEGYFVRGLPNYWDDGDQMLLYIYPEGDCDNPYDKEKMLSCLYDLYQCNDTVKEGDQFVTPFGNFYCVSFHVISEEEKEVFNKMEASV